MTIVAIQGYFEHIWTQAVYEKVLAPPSEQLKEVRGRDDWNLTHYMYMDKPSGQVRIPVDHGDGVGPAGRRRGQDVLSREGDRS